MEYPRFITTDGKEHVVIPVEDYNALIGHGQDDWTLIPHDVAKLVTAGESPLKAWRKHLKRTQAQAAEKKHVTRDNYKHYESSARPQRKTLLNAANGWGIKPRQLIELYYEEDISTPVGWTMPSEEDLA